MGVGVEGLSDPPVQGADAPVELQQGRGDLGDDARGDVLAGDGGVLRVGGLQCGRGDVLGAADLAGRKPGRQARATAGADRGGVWYPVWRTTAPRLVE